MGKKIMTSSYYTLLLIFTVILYHCHAFLQSPSSSSSYNYCSLTLSDTVINFSVTGANNDDDVSEDGVDEEQQHLHGIGVGIDLGTTNSAVAMMMIDHQNEESPSGRTVPTMIKADEEGSNTIPSVVSLVPTSSTSSLDHINENDSEQQQQYHQQQLLLSSSQLPPHEIHIGNSAIQNEQLHPQSTYRNVKRVIGTGGRMANLASGVVPNLYIQSVNGNGNTNNENGGELDELFTMLDEENGNNKKSRKKNKKNNKTKSKWKKRKEGELPKLHVQLKDAKDDPALLSCNILINNNNGASSSSSSSAAAVAQDDDMVLLRPEQISACILRKLYDTAEQHYIMKNNSNNNNNHQGEGERIKVTRAVIGVPAYFTEAQKEATKRASELAGVPKVKLLPEPEAAALAYGSSSSSSSKSNAHDKMYDINNNDEELILVFDLGGGTFDVSILEVGGGITEVLATIGNNRLGGTDFDKRVAEYLCSCAVDFDRKNNNSEKKRKNIGGSIQSSLDIDDNDKSATRRKKSFVKDWYRHGSGEVPDIILREAEEVRKCLSNQKIVDVLVPLTEDGWKQVGGGGSSSDENDTTQVVGESIESSAVICPSSFNKTAFETQYNMIEGEDYIIVTLDRTKFESICYNELQLLLQPIREVAIMAGVLLPGEARPSFVENAMLLAKEREEAMMAYNDYEQQDFWEFENEDDDAEPLIKSTRTTNKDATVVPKEETLNEQAMQQIQALDIKAQKKAQQRGRKKARDIDKRERSFRKQKQSAMDEATTASLLGKQIGGGKNKRKQHEGSAVSSSTTSSSVSVGNERVQEGIHGRPLSRIVLVGGATRMPVIAKLLEAVVGMVPQRTVHPDEAVALGCAVQVGILDGENDGLLGGMQAVLSPMQAAVMRALAKKRGMDVTESGELTMIDEDDSDNVSNMEMIMAGGISGMIVDEFDDEDDFY